MLRDELVGAPTGHRLNPPHPGGDPALRSDLEQPHLPGARQVRPPAQLAAVSADADHADPVPVFFAKQRHGAEPGGLGVAHPPRPHRQVRQNLLVHAAFDRVALLRGQGRKMDEVEPQAVRSNQRPGLARVFAHHLAQGLMQQVRRGMVAHDVPPAWRIDFGAHRLPDTEAAGRDAAPVHGHPAQGTVSLEDLRGTGRGAHEARVPHLTAALRVKRCAIQDDLHLGSRIRLADRLTAGKQRHNAGTCRMLRVSDELAAAAVTDHLRIPAVVAGSPEGLRGPRPAALRLHGAGKPCFVDGQPALPRDVARHLHRKAKRIVEPEHLLAGELTPRGGQGAADQLFQALQSSGERLGESLLLLAHRRLDERLLPPQLGVGVTHGIGDGAGQLCQERPGQAGGPSKSHRPPHDHPQDVVPAFVAGHDAIGHQERHGAAVVGHHAVGDGVRFPLAIRMTEDPLQAVHQRCEEVGAIIVIHPLQHRGDPLQAHAGIDPRLRQRSARPIGVLIELHEDEIPDLQPPETPVI